MNKFIQYTEKETDLPSYQLGWGGIHRITLHLVEHCENE